jgi:hypothetical protein
MKKAPFDRRIKDALDTGLDEIGETVARLKATESKDGADLSVTTRALIAMRALMAAVTIACREIMAALIGKANDDEVTDV